MTEKKFPEMITSLPSADISIEGVKGWIAQGKNFQIVFFEIEPGKIPAHSHSAQWGIVLEGEMILTIEGETKKFKKGDSYFIPEGAIHDAECHTFVRALDFFADPQRYKPKDYD